MSTTHNYPASNKPADSAKPAIKAVGPNTPVPVESPDSKSAPGHAAPKPDTGDDKVVNPTPKGETVKQTSSTSAAKGDDGVMSQHAAAPDANKSK